MVTCLATDESLTADPGVASSFPARSGTFVEIDHEIISMVILLPSAESVVVDFLFIVTPIVGVCNCFMYCCTLFYVHSSIAIILMGKRELIALLNLSSWCLVMVERLSLAVPWGSLQFVIVVISDHTHLLFLLSVTSESICTKYWLTACSSLPRKKLWLGELTIPP